MGMRLEKEWMAILDSHTRHVHAALDGRCVYVDKPFDCLLGDALSKDMTCAEWVGWKEKNQKFGMYRQIKNTGVFAHLPESMRKNEQKNMFVKLLKNTE